MDTGLGRRLLEGLKETKARSKRKSRRKPEELKIEGDDRSRPA
jgi:hypothetical protein